MEKETAQKICHLLGLTYNDLAEQSGYSEGAVRSYMNGTRKVSEKMQDFFAQKLREKTAAGDETLLFIAAALAGKKE